jgi:monoterpene epsilon-lactone hydrolase
MRAPHPTDPPAAVDVVLAYRGLLERGVKRIAIAGDSAGGNLTLASALEIGKLPITQPVALGCISPVVTMRDEPPSVTENRDRDAMFPPGMMDGVIARYAPGVDLADPRLSPLHAADLSRMPPTIFQCGETETLRDHSVLMSQRMSAAGVTTQLEVTPSVFHVWHLAADMVPEAKSAVDRLVAFLRPRVRG